MRNVFAHGSRKIDQREFHRLRDSGFEEWAVGSAVSLEFQALQLYRSRLKSLVRLGGVGKPTDNESEDVIEL